MRITNKYFRALVLQPCIITIINNVDRIEEF